MTQSYAIEEDRPALSSREREIKDAIQSGGALVGGALGFGALAYPWYRSRRRLPAHIQYGLLASSSIPALSGAVIGYHKGRNLSTYILAKRHKVDYHVEEVSQYYDINVNQYRPILIAAQNKDEAHLKDAVIQVFGERFGADWQRLLYDGFTKYGNYLHYLFRENPAKLSLQDANLRRMIEIGAALENIYFNKQPSFRNVIKEAAQLYGFLDFLHDTQGRVP